MNEKNQGSLTNILDRFSSVVDNQDSDKQNDTGIVRAEYICGVCGEKSIDENLWMPEDEEPQIIECDNCIETRERKERLDKYFSMVPKRYRVEMVYDGPEQLKVADCSIVYGNYGTGKTWNSYSLCQNLFVNKKIFSFMVVREADIVHSFRKGDYESYNRYDLLIIDEFTKSADTEFVRSEIFNLIDYRYDEMKKTILVCNARDKEQLKKMIDFAVLDRYRSSVHFFDGKSRRHSDIN